MDNTAAATPDTRDRYIDLLRVLSLGVVVVSHWLMAVVLVGPDGTVRARHGERTGDDCRRSTATAGS